ncbi:MAG TPA: TM1812 family CRISPR-associated protein [Methylocella sp.]|nr:TM1812 family CRISPR-associated protein [Methylocella sp.]
MSESSGVIQVTRLVTFLGTGNYQETVCQFGEHSQARPTRYVGRAFAEIFKAREVTVLATDQALDQHKSGLEEALREGNLPAPIFVRIPMGKNADERWDQFRLLKHQLRDCDGPVMLDVTHGFRSQPLFAASIVAFVRAIDETPPELRVCYAAFDARHGNFTPIWEITEFIALLDWAQSLRMLFKTGRAQEAAHETMRLGRALAKAWAESGKQGDRPNLDKLGTALHDFGADLETLRTGDLLIGRESTSSSVSNLLKRAQEAQEHVKQYAPPLADVLDRVVELTKPIADAGQDLSGPEGRKAVVELAKLYLRLGRYLEAAATVREGWINLYAPKTALVPGATTFDSKERKRAEERASKHDPDFQEVTDRRNDFLHAQYRPSTQRAADIAETVKSLVVEKLRIASEAQRGACFVNLSNHPSAKWDEAQTKAALALAERIEDIAFPAVPPDAGEKEIKALAKECAAKVPPETSHALVQGEFTLTVELVRELQARGITCLAATSKRDVEEGDDGRRVSTFTFVRFRAYPGIGRNKRCH